MLRSEERGEGSEGSDLPEQSAVAGGGVDRWIWDRTAYRVEEECGGGGNLNQVTRVIDNLRGHVVNRNLTGGGGGKPRR